MIVGSDLAVRRKDDRETHERAEHFRKKLFSQYSSSSGASRSSSDFPQLAIGSSALGNIASGAGRACPPAGCVNVVTNFKS
jgi:hypothetical protein